MSVEAQKEKQVIIDEIKEKLDGAQSAVVIDYMGITVAQADAMRKKLREANVDYTVYKNTLVKRAIAGTEFEGLAEVLDGPSALAISKEDATAPARVLNEVIKDYKKMEFKEKLCNNTKMAKADKMQRNFDFAEAYFNVAKMWAVDASMYGRKYATVYCPQFCSNEFKDLCEEHGLKLEKMSRNSFYLLKWF